MKTWRRCVLKHGQACGGPCRSVIAEGQPMLEVKNDQGIRLVRCAACAKHRYGMEPPEVFPEVERIAVSETAPTPHEHGTVSAREMVRQLREKFQMPVVDTAHDFKRRQSGE